MAVPVSKRSESQLEVITQANKLAGHTIRICSNEKNFPKRYRWCITGKIVDTVIEIVKSLNIANSIKALWHISGIVESTQSGGV